VDEQHVLDRGLARLENLRGRERPLRDQAVAHQLELAYREDVPLADVGVVARRVADSHKNRG
jgi:hypothetical protein